MSRVGPSLIILAAALSGCGTAEEFYFYAEKPAPATPGYRGPPDRAPQITMIFVAPLETAVGASVTLAGTAEDPDFDALSFEWSAQHGTIATPTRKDATFTCKAAGEDTVTLTVSDGSLFATQTVPVTCL